MQQPPLIEIRNVGKTFPGVQALNGVSLTLRAGESTPSSARMAPANPR
ncbi:hypothetical protein [Devosia sp.]|nr:hypothetical protein [Devosia sp.]